MHTVKWSNSSILIITLSISQQSWMVPRIAMYHQVCTVQWSNSSISNNSIEHESFVSQFECQTVLFDS